MLKRSIVRLLMFGIPFCMAYFATRPATPTAPAQKFVVCAYDGEERQIVIAADRSACQTTRNLDAKFSGKPGATKPSKDFSF